MTEKKSWNLTDEQKQAIREAVDDYNNAFDREGVHVEIMLDAESGDCWSDFLHDGEWKEYRDENVLNITEFLVGEASNDDWDVDAETDAENNPRICGIRAVFTLEEEGVIDEIKRW